MYFNLSINEPPNQAAISEIPQRSSSAHRFALTALVALFTFLMVTDSGTSAEVSKELQVKCSYLHNFPKFVEWPPEAFASETSALIIGVYGDEGVAAELGAQIQGRTVGKRPFQVRKIERSEDIAGIHLLYLSDAPDPVCARLLSAAMRGAIITVGDSEQFVHGGGIIRFVLEEGKVRFEINQGTAEAVKLKLSPQLLKLARVVRKR